MESALFVHVPEGDSYGSYYLAANKTAGYLGVKLSKMKFRDSDMAYVRAQGYIPRLTNGQEIGKVKLDV